MNKDCFKHLAGRSEKTLPRLKHPRIGRDKTARPFTVELPIHDLSDRTKYRAHRYTLDREYFAIRTSEVIGQHDLLQYEGEILKVASVSEIAPGAVEIKTIRFARYQD